MLSVFVANRYQPIKTSQPMSNRHNSDLLFHTESHDEPCTDFGEHSFGTDYHISLELPLSSKRCKEDMETYITKLFKTPYPFLIFEHQVRSSQQPRAFYLYFVHMHFQSSGRDAFGVWLLFVL